MELKQIDKCLYKRRLNRFQAALVAGLFILGLGFSSLYIELFSQPGESNFVLNLAGVISALFVVAVAANLVKNKPWMAEIRYVWQLKQELNRIYRASRKLEAALQQDDDEALLQRALVIRYFSLHGSKHLYQLENNTLTLDDLNLQIAEFDQRLAALGKTIRPEDYQPQLLAGL
ncbi:DUF3087 family protein [Bacterioplanoides pacificum]|uniref:DUF3087 family protein n=1 Tax=Bacterioplanoides pacificum TaxID=1171596 RepID=A0ABV7VUR2_9GAMM